MIYFKLDYQLPKHDLDIDIDLTKLVFSVLNGHGFSESYEVDSGGFLYQQKLDDNGEIKGVEKMESYTGTVILTSTVIGEPNDALLFYEVEFAKGKLLDAKFVESIKIKSELRKSELAEMAKFESLSQTWWYKFLYRPYSWTINVSCQIIITIIYYISMWSMRSLKWFFEKITPYG